MWYWTVEKYSDACIAIEVKSNRKKKVASPKFNLFHVQTINGIGIEITRVW